jgi:hypothetical protein
MRLSLALLFAAMFCATTHSETPVLDGARLLNVCTQDIRSQDGENSYNAIDASFCNGYVLGMMDAVGAVGTVEATGVRMPQGVTSGQTVRVVEHWLRNHPEQLNKHAGTLVVQILRETWPAKESRQ